MSLSLAEQYQYALSQLQAASILRPPPEIGSRVPEIGSRVPEIGSRVPDIGSRVPDIGSRDSKPDPNFPSSFYRPAGAPITPISPDTFAPKPESNLGGLYSGTRPLDYHNQPYTNNVTNSYNNPFFGVPSVLPVPVLHQAPPTPSPDRTIQQHHHHPFSALALSGAIEDPPSSSSAPSGSNRNCKYWSLIG